MSKRIVVTGAGSGIGAAVTQRLTDMGHEVVGCGRTMASLESVAAACNGLMRPVVCDVTDWQAVQNMAKEIGQPIDGLIHNAGFGQCKSIDDLDVEEWQSCLAVAATGAFYTAKALLPLLRSGNNGAGHILQVASLAAGGAWNMEIGYGTAKGAQLKFHLHLLNQLQQEAAAGGRLIHAHAVCPGSVFTPFWQRIPERPQQPEDCLTADEVAWLLCRVLEHPTMTAQEHAQSAPRPEVRIAPHHPWAHEPSVMEIKHQAHD